MKKILIRPRVLLVTSGEPVKNLGGPSRFVPMLAKAIDASPFSSSVELEVLMGRRLYKGAQLGTEELAQSHSGFMRAVVVPRMKRLMRPPFYSFYVPGKIRFELAQLRQKRLYGRIVKSGEYHVVHCHDYLSAVSLIGICRQLSIPLIFTNHFKGSLYREFLAPAYPYFRSRRWQRFFCQIEKRAICVADVLTFPSESARDLLMEDFPELAELIEKKSKVIYTGINDPKDMLSGALWKAGREGLARGQVVNIGNHIPDKGVDLSLRVFRQLLDITGLDLCFVNFGEAGPETPKLHALVRELGIGDRVVFRGLRPHEEVLWNVREAFLALHTPRKVVFDLSLLEIMALGTVVVATGIKGNEEALGKDYPLFVSIADLKLSEEQVVLLLENRRGISDALRSRYERKFRISRMVEDYVELWTTVAGETLSSVAHR